MKYQNASEILPEELLKELQRYAPGEILYVPSGKDRKKWGEANGAQCFYEQRNADIRYKYFHLTATIDALAEEYSLSNETVRKILYR